MTPEWLAALAAIVSLVGSAVVGLVVWGARAQVSNLRAEIRADRELSAQEFETLRAEVRAGIAESGARFFAQVNGNYVKRDLYNTLLARVDGLEGRVNDLGGIEHGERNYRAAQNQRRE